MRQSHPPISYLIGSPRGRVTKLKKALLERPWQARLVRPQALAGQAGALCAGSQPCPHRQGTHDAAAQVEMAVGRLKELGHAPEARRATDETRRRAQQGKGGVAVGGHRSGSADRQLQPHAQPRQLRKVRREGATCSAPISTNTRRRSCRSSTSEPQGRPGSAPDLPSNDRADRSAHLRHLHGLLSPRHVACEAEPVGGRPHAEAVLNKFAAIQIIDVRFPTTEVRT